jgi:flagellin
MALRIQTNVEALNVYGKLNRTNDAVNQSLERLSSGLRINSAKDDVSGFAVANAFKAKVSSLKVAQQNVSEADSFLQVYDGAYNKIHDIMVRMKDLATQAASGQTADTTTTLNQEFAYLQSEIDRIAASTTYSTNSASMTYLSGSGTETITFQIGSTNNSNHQLAITLDSACTQGIGASGGTVNISSDAISINNQTSAQAAMTTLDSALTKINESMGKLGAYQNRLEMAYDNLAVQVENLSASESVIRDVDMASETVKFTKNQILQQSGMAMLAQANMAPQQVLQLLG